MPTNSINDAVMILQAAAFGNSSVDDETVEQEYESGAKRVKRLMMLVMTELYQLQMLSMGNDLSNIINYNEQKIVFDLFNNFINTPTTDAEDAKTPLEVITKR